MWIYSWNFFSKGARALADELDAYLIRHERSRYKGRPRRVVINWGASELPDEVHRSTVINPPLRLKFMTDKLKFFRLVHKKARVPDWTDDKTVAEGWLRDGHDVVCRAVLNGHSGVGITLVKPGKKLPDVPLYTKYVPKMSEFRIHIVGDAVVDVQRKAARRGVPEGEINWQIRNLAGGFVYSRQNVVCPQDVKDQALAAFAVTKLHFGAVDVVWNQKQKKAYVLEINTAPGLEGETVVKYAEALRTLGRELRNAL